MLRKILCKINVTKMYGVWGLCTLLIIALLQHQSAYRGNLNTPDYSSAGNVSVFTETNDSQSVPEKTTATDNITAIINDVIAQLRVKLADEMKNFEYPTGRFGLFAKKLSDLTPETGGTPIRNIVVSSWRSGSSFLGDLLDAMPGSIYRFEPLFYFGGKLIRDPGDVEQAIKAITDLLECNVSDTRLLLERMKRLIPATKELPFFHNHFEFLLPFCKLFPVQNVKTVLLRLSSAEALLKNKSLNVRIIYLVRDPRGTMQSRRDLLFCQQIPECIDIKVLCADLVADYNSAEVLLKKYPARFRTLRYEDLSLNSYNLTQELLQFLGLPFDPMVKIFLDSHTKLPIGNSPYSTFRDSKTTPFNWIRAYKPKDIEHIQQNCKNALDLWGYRMIDNFTDELDSFNPLIMPPPFS